MTGLKKNNEVCFLETLTAGRDETKLIVSRASRAVIKCFVIPPNSKIEKRNYRCQVYLSQICRDFKAHYQITCESKVHVVVSTGVSEFCSR